MPSCVRYTVRKYLPKPAVNILVYVIHAIQRKIPNHQLYLQYVAERAGLEIGGPSVIFKTVLPLYRTIGTLDGVNFSTNTMWEGNIKSGKYYNYTWLKKGFQYISDATTLTDITSEKYEVVLSSNCLEHIANPIRALIEWRRVLTPNGFLILVLPNKISNFDHKRTDTTFEHILEDFKNDTSENDLTHLDEILQFHDLSRDPAAGGFEDFRERSLKNFNNRSLHHHVFGLPLIEKMLMHTGFHPIDTTETHRDIYILARKTPGPIKI